MKYNSKRLDELARNLFKEERAIKRLDGWFILKEAQLEYEKNNSDQELELRTANALYYAIEKLPVYLSKNNIFAGTERDAFAQSYALINPNFKVSTFNGYCNPTAVFDDIEPNDEFSTERIDYVKQAYSETPYVKDLAKVYSSCQNDTKEVIYFVEQVTGHLIPDVRPILANGLDKIKKTIEDKIQSEIDTEKRTNWRNNAV